MRRWAIYTLDDVQTGWVTIQRLMDRVVWTLTDMAGTVIRWGARPC